MRRLVLALVLVGCGGATPAAEPPRAEREPMRFGDDLAFLRDHVPEVVVLSRGEARVAVVPEYQGRVMTSSARGDAGPSCGFLHRPAIESGERVPHMNVFGGEDRFWLGPEGGQFGLYFPPGAPFDLAHWQVPEPIDWGGWEITRRATEEVAFARDMSLSNASGTSFSIHAERTVRLLSDAEVAAIAGPTTDLDVVAYESVNAVTNTGAAPWRAETGLVSIWILSMYPPSPGATVVVPFRTDATGTIVNDGYFGAVPADRLVVDAEAGVVYFRADGLRRGKIGVPFPRARPVLGSWDADREVLTLVRYTLPTTAPSGYVMSTWEHQAEPFGGDVVNSYNDGPPEGGGAPLGPFYELESSSPALALAPGERAEHVHTTLHLMGDRAALDAVAHAVLGVSLVAIEAAL